jgi:hypothetical protein
LKPEIKLIFNSSVPTSQRKHGISIMNTHWLVKFREILEVYCENPMKDINMLCGPNAKFLNVKAGVSCCNHCSPKG